MCFVMKLVVIEKYDWLLSRIWDIVPGFRAIYIFIAVEMELKIFSDRCSLLQMESSFGKRSHISTLKGSSW